MKTFWFLLMVSGYASLMLLTGCASASMGSVQRFEAHGQQILCWEPSQSFNGLAGFIANRFEGSPGLNVDRYHQKNLTKEDEHVLKVGPAIIKAAKQAVAAYKQIPKNVIVTRQVTYAANVLQQALDSENLTTETAVEQNNDFSIQYTRR